MPRRVVLRDFEASDPRDDGTGNTYPRPDGLGSDGFGPGVLVPGASYDGSQAARAARQEAYPAGLTTGQYRFSTATTWIQGYEARFHPEQGVTENGGEPVDLETSVQCIASWKWTDPDTSLQSSGEVLVNVFEKSIGTSTGPAIPASVSVTQKYTDAGTTVISDDVAAVIGTTLQWFKFLWLPSGSWSIGPLTGAPYLSGTIPQMPSQPGATPSDIAGVGVSVHGGLAINVPGPCLMDNIAVYLHQNVATRAYPRDDGLGIDGNSRIHPPPKSRRIVGGHL